MDRNFWRLSKGIEENEDLILEEGVVGEYPKIAPINIEYG